MLPKIIMNCFLSAIPSKGLSQQGKEYSRFSVVCSAPKMNLNETVQSHFFNCVAFGKTATYINSFLKKGDRVYIEGNLATNSYVSKEGKPIKTVQIYVDRIELVKRSANNESENQLNNLPYNNNSFDEINIDDEIKALAVNSYNQNDSDSSINVFEISDEEETDEVSTALNELYNNKK